MADLIDPRPLIRDLTAMKTEFDAITLDGIIQALKKTPTVDAVPVVRCKDCRYLYFKDFSAYCPHQVGPCWPDGYCIRGERRNDDEVD